MPIVQTLPGVTYDVDLRLSYPADVRRGRLQEFGDRHLSGHAGIDRPLDQGAPSEKDLGCIIEGEIIPRLLLSHSTQPHQMQRSIGQSSAERARTLAQSVVEQDIETSALYVQSLVDSGTDIEDIFVDVVAHAARYLGERWEEDDLSFVDVTIGLSRLQQLLHRFGSNTTGYHDIVRSGRRALLLPTPGEQHTLGLIVVEDAFRRAGWEVWGGHEVSRAELHNIIVSHEVQLVGFTLSSESLLDELTASIEDLRSSCHGAGMPIVVGGRYFSEDSEAYKHVGADAAAKDAREAVRISEELVDRIVLKRV